MRALGATSSGPASGPGPIRGVGVAGFAAPEPRSIRQFRHRMPAAMGAVAGCPITATSMATPACAPGRCGAFSIRWRKWARALARCRRWPPSGDGGGRPRSDADLIQGAGALRAAQVAVLLAGLAAPGATTVIEKEATRDHTEQHAQTFRRDVRVYRVRRSRPPITLPGPARARGCAGRGAGRSVIGGVSSGCRADRAGL